MRFGFTPLFIDEGDVDTAISVVGKVMAERLWDDPRYQARGAVT